jgi:predicted O-linked N-acetylglucosamine transferase (SPINDLY family)
VAERNPTRAELGLPETGFVFCTFARHSKITSVFFDLWMNLLAEVSGSVLWLVGGSAVQRNLRAEAERCGIDPARLVFAGFATYPDHLARHVCADLCLDTLPFNGGTTTSDALFMGLPVLTISGSALPARMAGSLLTALGLPELIAPSLEEYRAHALMLAKNPDALAGIKAKLVRNKDTSPLFDTARFCRHLEQAFVTMWERTQRGEKPTSFSVPEIV